MSIVPENPLHTWTLRRNSSLLRFYLWAYMVVDNDNVNFCQLFWGVVLFPVWAPFRFILGGAELIMQHHEARPKEDSRSKIRDRGEKFLDGASSLADRVAAFFQRHSWIGPLVLWTIFIAVVGGLLSLLGWAIYAMGLHATGTLQILADMGLAFAALIVALCISIPLLMLLDRIGFFRKMGDGIYGGACFVGVLGKSVGKFFVAGYHAVKYRTCPRVTVTD